MLFFIYGFFLGCVVSLGAVLAASVLIQSKILVGTEKVAEPRQVKLRGVKRPDNELARKSSTTQRALEMEEIISKQKYSGKGL